jgi:ribosomal protein S12 methylthiotransferase
MINQACTKTTREFYKERLSQGQRVGLINLGCARNLVDSQAILGRLKRNGHRIVDVERCDIAIVNTCAFIEEAKRESIDTILDLIAFKKKGKLKKVIVAGCLAQRYGKELAKEFKDIDAILGVQKLDRVNIPDQASLTPKHYAYVKICESCYNSCKFCIIPRIKGKFVSRTMETVLKEIQQWDAKGVKEINIIGQDITAYGMDIYHKKSLAKLLKKIVTATRNIQWIRLLYTFPAHVNDELIDVMAGEEKICNYIDMPLQHISENLLHSMKRGITTKATIDLIHKIKSKIPTASIRTTFIVGLPGETNENFQELVNFVKDTRFEKMGVFVYSREEGTPAYDMPDQVPEQIKKKRLDTLMHIQQEISKCAQERFIGQSLKVLIDEKQKGVKDIFLGRTMYDAPEVDGVVYVHSKKKLKLGEMVNVTITDAYEYDLAGEVM